MKSGKGKMAFGMEQRGSFLTSLCYLLWKNKSPLQNIFAQFLDCWACVVFSYFPLCNAPKLIPTAEAFQVTWTAFHPYLTP